MENFSLWYDPEVITIILDNLISNAIKIHPFRRNRPFITPDYRKQDRIHRN